MSHSHKPKPRDGTVMVYNAYGTPIFIRGRQTTRLQTPWNIHANIRALTRSDLGIKSSWKPKKR